jgi:MFS family permease
MARPEPPRRPYAALEQAPFRWFVASLLTMTMAAQVQAVVVGWQVYQITRDPFALGLLGLAEVVPYVAVALFAGYVVDRNDRRRVSLWALAVLLVAALALLAMNLRAGLPGHVWPYYAVLAVCGVARSFLQTSRSALIAEIVDREHFANAATWRSSTWQLGTVIGPALGGVLFGVFGARVALGVNVAMVAAALGAMSALRHVPTPLGLAAGSLRQNLVEGIRFVYRKRVILGALSLDLLAVFFGGAIAMMPVYASDILRVGPQGLGWLQAAPGVGAVAMAVVIAHRGPFRRAGVTLLGSVAVFGVAMIAFAVSRSFLFSVVMLVVSGAADNISAVIRSTLIQVLVPPDMLGRVSAINTIFIGSSNELGAFESGVAARLFGVVPSVALGGVMTLVVVAVIGIGMKEVRSLRQIRAW